jgi:hypothetical protein
MKRIPITFLPDNASLDPQDSTTELAKVTSEQNDPKEFDDWIAQVEMRESSGELM